MDFDALIRGELDDMQPYAPGLRISEVRERSGHKTILKLSSNEHPLGPFPGAVRAIEAVLPQLNRYPDGSVRALRRRLSEKLGFAAENVVVGNGSNELIRLIAQAVLRPGDEVVFAWPSFIVYPMIAKMFGATAVKVPLDANDTHDLEAILAAITERTRLVFLCNPNNPTGTIYHKNAFEYFLEQVPEQTLVVVDEAYFEFVCDERYPDTLAYFNGERPLCVLRTFSKIYSLAGLRVGYGIVPEPVRMAIDKLREPFNVNTVSQIAAYYSLADEAEVDRRRLENHDNRAALCEAFERLGIDYVPSEANFVYFKTERPAEVFGALLEESVIVRDFGNAPALRISIGTERDTEIAIAAFEGVVARLGAI